MEYDNTLVPTLTIESVVSTLMVARGRLLDGSIDPELPGASGLHSSVRDLIRYI